MVKYRRYYAPNAIYFFTVTLLDRQSDYLTKYVNELTDAIKHVRKMYPFNSVAMVVLPDHLHVMWQRRFWEHVIRNEQDYEKHVDYIHYNPVKHQLVKNVADWPYSTFHKYVRQGILSRDWCYKNEDMQTDILTPD